MIPREPTLEQKLQRTASDWTEILDAIENPILPVNEALESHRLNVAAARLTDNAPPEDLEFRLPVLQGRCWRGSERGPADG